MPNPLEYAFWAGDSNNNMSLDQLKRRQAVAAALAGQKRGYPKNLGEGIAALGEGIGQRLQENRLREAEDAFNTKYGKQLGAAPPPNWGTGAPTRGAAPVAPPTSVMPTGLPLGAGMPTAGAVAPPPTAPPAPGTAEAAPEGNDVKTRIALALLGDDAPGGAQVNPTVPDQAAGGQPDPTTLARRAAIARIESGGNYGAVGPVTRGDRPYGKYQVMGANIGPWSQEALGQRLTPREFLNDPYAQDKVFDYRMADYARRFGEEGAAQAWFGGPGSVGRTGRRDILGTSVGDYGRRYVAGLGGAGGDEAPAGGGGDGRPVQFAARGDTGATMSDAPPISASVVGDDTEQEETPTEIKVAPSRVQLAQAPRGVIPGSVALPGGMLDPRPSISSPATSAAPPGARPSELPIPEYREQTMPDPGPRPEPPNQIPYSPRQRHFIDLLNDRNAPDWVKDRAKREFDLEEKFRTDLTTRQEADYVNRRELWEKADAEKKKFDRERDVRRVDELTKWIALQKARPDAEKADVDLDRARVELEDAIYKTGIPREQARREAELKIAQAERNLAKPDEFGAGGTHYTRRAGAPATEPFTVPPGLPQPKEDPMTETQAKGVQLVLRTTPDLDVVERELRYGKVMSLPQEAWRNLPIIGNMTVSDEYRRARDALGNWGSAFLTHVSGAAVSPSEALRNLPAFIPQAGDTDQELLDKARRRRDMTTAVEQTTGRAGLEAIKRQIGDTNEDYRYKKANEMEPLPQGQVKTPEDAKLLPSGRRFILPDGNIGTVPRRAK